MLTLHSIEPAPTDISARAVQTLVSALDAPDRAAAVAAAIALLAISRDLPVNLVTTEAAGIAVEISAGEPDPAHSESHTSWNAG
jgi:hypothetical protein